MDIMRRIENARGLTPTEQQLASTARSLGPRLQGYSIKEFAVAAHVSIPSVHRFCKKIGLEGFKELKVEFARAQALREHRSAAVDINFPFLQDDDAETVLESISAVYESTLRDTREFWTPPPWTAPPVCSTKPASSISTRNRTTSIPRRCSATACSHAGTPLPAMRASSARRGRR